MSWGAFLGELHKRRIEMPSQCWRDIQVVLLWWRSAWARDRLKGMRSVELYEEYTVHLQLADEVAEAMVLGLLFYPFDRDPRLVRDQQKAWERAQQRLTATDFFVPEHRALFEAGLGLVQRQQRPSLAAVRAEMQRRDTWRLLRGNAWLNPEEHLVFLATFCGDLATHIDWYIRPVREAAIRRRVLASALQLADAAMDASKSSDELLALGNRLLRSSSPATEAVRLAHRDTPVRRQWRKAG